MGLYKAAGAKYFMALAQHHDNLDCWDSKHQPWNSVAIGPKKDIVGTWAKAARAAGDAPGRQCPRLADLELDGAGAGGGHERPAGGGAV